MKPTDLVDRPPPLAADAKAGRATRPTSGNRKRDIGLKLTVLARQMRQSFDERVEQMGVTRAKWTLTAAVARNPGATQRMIAAQLEVTEVTAGRLIDRLCADGLMERRENPNDRRAYCVHLTAAARPILDKLAKAVETYESEMFAAFSEDELATLDTLLDKLSGSVSHSRREVGSKPASLHPVSGEKQDEPVG